MDSSEIYPGSDLNIAQLAYALDRKLNVESTNCLTVRNDYTPEKLIKVEKSLVWCIAGVRAFQNAFSPINRLHPETIAYILGLVANECRIKPPGNWDGPYDWIDVGHVCRYWRNTTLSLPSMWSTIDSARPRMARHCLQLSKSTPLHVALDAESPDHLFHGVQMNLLRVRRLEINFGTRGASSLAEFNDSPAPLLEHLELRLNSRSQRLPPLFQAEMPSLKCLRLERFLLEHPISHVVNLVDFELTYEASTRRTSMVRLLDVLHSNPKLHRVKLVHCGPRGLDDADPNTIVKLENLECLWIICSTHTILNHLALPRAARLVLQDWIDSEIEGFVQEILPRVLDYLENLHELHTLGFQKALNGVCSVEALGPEDHPGVQGSMLFTVRYDGGGGLPLSRFYQRSLYLMQPLCVTHVKHLWLRHVDFPAERPRELPGPIKLALISMPNLETFVLLNCRTDAVFEALLPLAAPCVCPRLRTLTIYDPQYFDPIYLMDMVHERKFHGAPLESVSLIFHPTRVLPIHNYMSLKKVVDVIKCEVEDEGPKWPFKE